MDLELALELNSEIVALNPGTLSLSLSLYIYIYIYIYKTTVKLNYVEMDFWRRSARIPTKDKIRKNIDPQYIQNNIDPQYSFTSPL